MCLRGLLVARWLLLVACLVFVGYCSLFDVCLLLLGGCFFVVVRLRSLLFVRCGLFDVCCLLLVLWIIASLCRRFLVSLFGRLVFWLFGGLVARCLLIIDCCLLFADC